MLYYDRNNVSERTDDVNKTSELKECNICYYSYFSHKCFKFQPNICNRCHDLLLMSMNFTDITVLNIKGSNFGCIISRISKKRVHKLNAKYRFERKKQNITKHEKLFS